MIKNTIQQDIQSAMKGGDAIRVSTLRLLPNAIHNEEIAMRARGQQRDLTEEEEFALVRRQVKQREEAVEAYSKGGRQEAAEKEKQEAEILKEFMPQQMSEEEIEAIVEKVITDLGKSDMSELGSAMKAVMAETKGKADGKTVSEVVKQKLKS